VECDTTGAEPKVFIDDVLPADGSLAPFDMAAVGSCIRSDGRRPNGEVRLHLRGVASTRVAPGQQPTILAESSEFPFGQNDTVWMTVTGDGGWRVASFTARYGRVNVQVPRAGASGSLTLRFWQMTAYFPEKFAPYGISMWCTFPATAPPLRIPIAG
jgi:hypothetical protein